MNQSRNHKQGKWFFAPIGMIVIALFLITAFLGFNKWLGTLELQDIDVTQNQLFTLSELSKQQIKDIQEKVTMYFIGMEENTSLLDLARQYSKVNPHIIVETIADISQRADLKAKYNITDETQLIVVETASKSKIILLDELYTYDYTTYQQIDLSEETLTNAICDVSLQEKTKLYVLTGHNEYRFDQEMTILNAYLTNEMNEVEALDLLVKTEVPEDADLLIIGSPQKDFLEQEVEMIIDYIERGGNILWMNDPSFTNEIFPNQQKILELYGVQFKEGIVLEQDENKIALQSPNYILPNITTTNATKDIATDGGVLLINASKIEIAQDEILTQKNVTSQVILSTSQEALFRTQVDLTEANKIDSDEEGRIILGASFEKQLTGENTSTLYAIANQFFVCDYPLTIGNSQMPPIYLYNNKDYMLNTIAELTDREEHISIRKDTGVVTYTATKMQDHIIKISLVVFPAAIMLIGVVIWWIRRRKK